jgi:hypothetical protein
MLRKCFLKRKSPSPVTVYLPRSPPGTILSGTTAGSSQCAGNCAFRGRDKSDELRYSSYNLPCKIGKQSVVRAVTTRPLAVKLPFSYVFMHSWVTVTMWHRDLQGKPDGGYFGCAILIGLCQGISVPLAMPRHNVHRTATLSRGTGIIRVQIRVL